MKKNYEHCWPFDGKQRPMISTTRHLDVTTLDFIVAIQGRYLVQDHCFHLM